MSGTTTGDHLWDLFSSKRWQEHFSTLSDTLGFRLSIYSETGALIFSSTAEDPQCGAFRSSPELNSRCERTCRNAMLKAVKRGRPRLYKCAARIMNFALPVEYLGERAVIRGQGSFSSYRDFRLYLDSLASHGIDGALPVTAPLRFTSARDAQNACHLVESSLAQLLNNVRETDSLQNKMESLKEIMGRWDGMAVKDAAAVFDHLLTSLFVLLDIHHAAILSFDPVQGAYESVSSRRRDGGAGEGFRISAEDPVVRELRAGKPFVLAAEPVQDPRAGFLNGMGALYCFPLWIRGSLESILAAADCVLKESDIRIVSAFSRQAALAIENLRLQQDLYRKFDRYAAIAELARDITPIQNYEILLQSILDKSAGLLKAEQGSLMLLDQETDALFLEARKGLGCGITEKLRIPKGEGFAGRVAADGEPLLVVNVEDDPRTLQKNRGHYKTRSFVSVPLKIGDRTIGVLNLSDKTSGEVFDEEDLRLIQSFATHAAVVLDRNALYSQTEKLKKLSITDPLTGLLNRRYLQDRLDEELSRSERHARVMVLLMLDLDGFKQYNDTQGHLAGDKALKLIAESLLRSVRSMDIVSRYGGDEFMVILPETDLASAVLIAERIRSDVARCELPPRPGSGAAPVTLTASIGIAGFPDHGETAETLLERVDQALYRAKTQGRNRTEVYS